MHQSADIEAVRIDIQEQGESPDLRHGSIFSKGLTDDDKKTSIAVESYQNNQTMLPA